MKWSRFSDEQIIAIVKEQEASMATAEVCRRHGISGATLTMMRAGIRGVRAENGVALAPLPA
jgi:putative transposase